MPEQEPLRHLLLKHQMTGSELLEIARTIPKHEVVVIGVSGHQGSIEFSDYPLILDFNELTAVSESRETRLTVREFELVGQLATRPDEVISRNELLEFVWHTPPDIIDPHVVDVHLSNAKRKLRDILPIPISPIQTVRSKGFVFYSKQKI
ncbi:winged helix family transcriptional regulator [bacterium]|nr:winged helix family transcriptional regulator [bacterium]